MPRDEADAGEEARRVSVLGLAPRLRRDEAEEGAPHVVQVQDRLAQAECRLLDVAARWRGRRQLAGEVVRLPNPRRHFPRNLTDLEFRT